MDILPLFVILLSHCASMIFGVSLSPKKWWRNLWMVPKVILLWRVLLNAVVGRKNLGLSFCKFVKIWSASILLFWWGWCIGVGTKYKWSSMAVRLDWFEILCRIFIGWKFSEILFSRIFQISTYSDFWNLYCRK